MDDDAAVVATASIIVLADDEPDDSTCLDKDQTEDVDGDEAVAFFTLVLFMFTTAAVPAPSVLMFTLA